MNKDDNFSGAARYYASPQEQKILVQGLLRYFSLPERSQNRNKIVKEVASYLSMLSPHWSHRAVRLWFNNNRHTYLPTINNPQMQQITTSNPNNNQESHNKTNQMSSFQSPNSNFNIGSNINTNSSIDIGIPKSSFPQQNSNYPNIQQNHQVIQNQQFPTTRSLKTMEDMPSNSFYNQHQMNKHLPTTQQPMTQYTSQVFNTNTNFMPQFQFNAQPSHQPPIQVNAPIQFNQRPSYQQAQPNNNQYPNPMITISTSTPSNISQPISTIPQQMPSMIPKQTSPQSHFKMTTQPVKSNIPIKPIQSTLQPQMQTSIPIKIPSNTKPIISTTNNPDLNFNSNSESKNNSIQNNYFNTNNHNHFYFHMNEMNSQQIEQVFIPISAMLNEIRKLYQTENDLLNPRLSQLITEFDRKCMQVTVQHDSIPPEEIEPMIDYVTFKFPSIADDANLGESVFPYSNSTNDFSEMNDHSMTFGGQETSVWDQITPNNIWQQRPFIDETLTYFENCILTDEYFAYTSLQFGSTQRNLSLKKYYQNNQSNANSLSSFIVDTESLIDSICINDDTAFLLSKNNVICISISQNFPQSTINLNSIMENSNLSVSEGLINSFGNHSAIVSFSNLSTLFFINSDFSISPTTTNLPGFIDVSSLGINREKILVCSSNSPTVRMISPEGIEISAFVGHLGQVMGVEPLTENIFASRGADKTVRIWDYRSPRMITTITTPNVSSLCITGSRNFVICGFSNKNIAVTDIRNNHGKPFLGVSTQDYNAIMMKYHSEDDSLMMFGQVEKDTTKDSMIFVDTNGHSRQRILRHYSHFTGVDCK